MSKGKTLQIILHELHAANKNQFQTLFEKNPEEQIEHRAYMLSLICMSEAEKAMDRRGWTRERLAEETNISLAHLTQLFRGERLLGFNTIAKMEQALDLEFEIRS